MGRLACTLEQCLWARIVRTPLIAAGPRRDPAARPSAARLLAHRVPARADAGALRNALAARRPPLAFSTRSGRTPSPGAAQSPPAAHRREDGCWTFSQDSSEARPPARPRLLRAGCRRPLLPAYAGTCSRLCWLARPLLPAYAGTCSRLCWLARPTRTCSRLCWLARPTRA
jgi:hypothetical protein